MARQFDFKKLVFMRAVRAVSTSSGCFAGNSVTGPGKPPATVSSKESPGGLLSRIKGDERLSSLVHSYEDIVGIGDVKRAQEKVTEVNNKTLI